jgi:putative transcriptional regulator
MRETLNLSQTGFATRFGFMVAAVRQWEQGRRLPHGPARVLLTIIAREPGPSAARSKHWNKIG